MTIPATPDQGHGIDHIPSVVEPSTRVLPSRPVRPTVIIFAIVVAILLTVTAFFSPREGAVDEIGLYNPTYMYLHYGKMTYPAHGFFDTMVVHPPLQYGIVAWLMRFGLSLYYAEATPAWAMSIICVLIVLLGPYSNLLKMGLLFGLYLPSALFPVEMFGLRPEMHLGFVWMAGLLLLEWAKLRQWDNLLLCAGAFLVTYAAGLHYYAAPACLAVGVYAVVLFHKCGLAGARLKLASLMLGMLLFGIPYLLWFVIPHFQPIVAMLMATKGSGGIREALRLHREHYQYWANIHLGGAAFRLPFRYSIPVVLISTPALMLLPQARVFALATLPLQLFILLAATHKHLYYFTHEVAIYGVGITVAALFLIERLLGERRTKIAEPFLLAGACIVLTYSLVAKNAKLSEVVISRRPMVNEAEVARAAAKEILGPNALVGGRIGLWYASGGATWYGVERDVLWPTHFDFKPGDYFRQFDAIADHRHMSNSTNNHMNMTLSSWYADGTLKLRGAYFAQDNQDLSEVLLQSERSKPVIAFGLKNNQLFRFEQRSGGDYETVSATCPDGGPTVSLRNHSYFSNDLYLPKDGPSAPQLMIVTGVVPAGTLDSLSSFAPECHVLDRITGVLRFADRDALLQKLSADDKPIQFPQNYGATAVSLAKEAESSPPAGVERRPEDGKIDEIIREYDRASVLPGRPVTVVTGPGMGSFAASVPIRSHRGEGWITVTAKVVAGRVGFGAFSRGQKHFLVESAPLEVTDRPIRITLHVNSLAQVDCLMIRNADPDRSSRVEIHDLAVWALRQTAVSQPSTKNISDSARK